MATAIKKPAIPGPGLKKQGVVVLQSFLLFVLVGLEMWIRDGAGILSGLAICLVTYGGVAYGRTGTRYVSAVTPMVRKGSGNSKIRRIPFSKIEFPQLYFTEIREY
jgi:hypothetical protein